MQKKGSKFAVLMPAPRRIEIVRKKSIVYLKFLSNSTVCGFNFILKGIILKIAPKSPEWAYEETVKVFAGNDGNEDRQGNHKENARKYG